jgi:hypothetical protein
MTVHQCPRCELRFRDRNELKPHLVDDHGVEPESLEPHLHHHVGVPEHRERPDPSRVARRDGQVP